MRLSRTYLLLVLLGSLIFVLFFIFGGVRVRCYSVGGRLRGLPSPGAAASPATPPSAGIPSFFGVVVMSTDLLLCLAPMFASYLLVPPVFISLAFWVPGGVQLNRPAIGARESIKISRRIFQDAMKNIKLTRLNALR